MIRFMPLLLVSAVLLAAACASPRGPLESCTDSAECVEGTTCFQPKFVAQDAGCFGGTLSSGTSCNRLCETNTDCAVLGDGYDCVRFGCPGSDSVCVRSTDGGTPSLAGADGGSP